MIRFFRSMGGRVFAILFFGIIGATTLGTFFAGHRMHQPLVIVAYGLGILALVYPIARMSTRPLRQLSAASSRLGKDFDSPPLIESGPTEVRDAAIAFNAMQARIQRDARDRTYMLAAITHDLQTPITRLRLRLEKVENEQLRQKLIADVAAMRDTVNEGLDLALSLESREPRRVVDLDSVLKTVCSNAQDGGDDVSYEGADNVRVLGSPNDLTRLFVNLIDNAIAYGHYARVTAACRDGWVRVCVRDGGSGIPDDLMERVVEPFFRVESSRSRATGGTGIGLTIATNIAERHGGTLRLCNAATGGLEATVSLPLLPGA